MRPTSRTPKRRTNLLRFCLGAIITAADRSWSPGLGLGLRRKDWHISKLGEGEGGGKVS